MFIKKSIVNIYISFKKLENDGENHLLKQNTVDFIQFRFYINIFQKLIKISIEYPK